MTTVRLEPAAVSWDFPRSTTGVAVLLRFAVDAGLSPQRVLVGTGLRATDVLAPVAVAGPGARPGAAPGAGPAEVTAAQELRVVRTLRHLLGEVGAAVGERYAASTFGAFGYAMFSSRTVLEAMAFAVRFIDLSHAFALPRAETDGSDVVVSLDGASLPADVRRFLLERDAVAVHRILESLVPGGVGAGLELGAAQARIRFGVDQLDRPLPQRSRARRDLAAQVCAEIVDVRRARSGLAKDVRVLIAQRLATGAPMGEVADALAVSERTLRRRLRAEGVGYQELLDEVRAALVESLLHGRTTMPVAAVAARLGYADAAALAHARARWRRHTGAGVDEAPGSPTPPPGADPGR